MAQTSRRAFPLADRNDGNGNHIRNLILLGLPPGECATILEKLEFVDSTS
jgi:hypothetical protein